MRAKIVAVSLQQALAEASKQGITRYTHSLKAEKSVIKRPHYSFQQWTCTFKPIRKLGSLDGLV